MKLYTFHQSGSSYRVRIALNLKCIDYEPVFVRGGRRSEELRSAAYLELNPQAVVPTLVHGGRALTQSLAIIEYLEEIHPRPALLPQEAVDRARVRALAQLVVSDTQPLSAARVIDFLDREIGVAAEKQHEWLRYWNLGGLQAFEVLVASYAPGGIYCHGDQPTLADICLIPQMYTARRFGCDLSAFPTIERIYERCLSHPAFQRAAPENQPDAPKG